FPAASRVMENTVIELPEATDCAGTPVPVPFGTVSAPGVVAAALPTVIVPEFVTANAPDVARMFAVPTSTPVKVALLLSPAGTRRSEERRVGKVSRDQGSAATFDTNLPSKSRVMEHSVIELPDGTECGG